MVSNFFREAIDEITGVLLAWKTLRGRPGVRAEAEVFA